MCYLLFLCHIKSGIYFHPQQEKCQETSSEYKSEASANSFLRLLQYRH